MSSSGYTSPGSMIALGSVLPAVDIILVALRFYARRRQKTKFMLDDWLLIPALIFTIAMGVCIIVGVKGHALGYRTSPLTVPGPKPEIESTAPDLVLAFKVEWINFWLQPLALGTIKMSIVLFYRRIFNTRVNKIDWFRRLLNLVILLLSMWTIAFFFAGLFECGTHFSEIWGPFVVFYKKCADGHEIWIDEALSISDFCWDIVVFILPLPKIWSLRMTVKRRLSVTFIFVVGASAIVGSIIRMVIVLQIVDGVKNSLASEDGLVIISQFLFWSTLEAGLAVVAACLPSVNYFFSGKMSATAVLRSIRRALSFESLRSLGSRGEGPVERVDYKTTWKTKDQEMPV